MVNEADLDWCDNEGDGETQFRRKKLAAAAGGEGIGTSLYELDPGEQSWPLHYHTANEEAIYILAGEGRLERGMAGADVPLDPGEYVALPADESGTHRIVNTASQDKSDGDRALRYLMISTMHEPDVTVYPEHDGIGVFVGSPPGSDDERTVSGFWEIDDAVEYWD
ncbi:cupin domain-containing protein [Halosegnis sp.]|uniref:cupin domain-containing protein n=1 Tax=Halosegnis sp. TaxID=2864959 RepID=UPI0035D5021A